MPFGHVKASSPVLSRPTTLNSTQEGRWTVPWKTRGRRGRLGRVQTIDAVAAGRARIRVVYEAADPKPPVLLISSCSPKLLERTRGAIPAIPPLRLLHWPSRHDTLGLHLRIPLLIQPSPSLGRPFLIQSVPEAVVISGVPVATPRSCTSHVVRPLVWLPRSSQGADRLLIVEALPSGASPVTGTLSRSFQMPRTLLGALSRGARKAQICATLCRHIPPQLAVICQLHSVEPCCCAAITVRPPSSSKEVMYSFAFSGIRDVLSRQLSEHRTCMRAYAAGPCDRVLLHYSRRPINVKKPPHPVASKETTKHLGKKGFRSWTSSTNTLSIHLGHDFDYRPPFNLSCRGGSSSPIFIF